jgi:O-antigen biosynthesis protein WbqP
MNHPGSLIFKRLFDFVVSALAFVPALPLIGLLIVIVRLDTSGPGIFKQQRVGRGKRLFLCLKIRTMPVGTPNVPTHDAGRVPITKIGRFLRSTKLDELPQLLNVIRGEMSLVGPRPCLPSQDELIAAREQRNIFSVRPGITGLAQVVAIDMANPKALARVDEIYLERCTLLLDLKIIARTLVRFRRR